MDDTRLYARSGSLWDGFGAGDGSFSGDGADDAECGDNRVLPVVWGANFITLWPGETTDIRFSFPSAAVAPPLRRGEALFVCAVGLNAAATLQFP